MRLLKCENGHFYDADKFPSCPHCSDTGGDRHTVPSDEVIGGSDIVTQKKTEEQQPVKEPEKSAGISDMLGGWGGSSDDDEDGVTQAFFGVEKVVGWLVCIAGSAVGRSYNLKVGKNFIGRNAGNDICLDGDDSVSRVKHAIVVYEPKKRFFIAQPGESSSLFYLNEEVVLSATALKDRDILTVGENKLMFVPFCNEAFGWDVVE